MAATLLKADMAKLRSLLSLNTASKELREATVNAREPYRDVIKSLEHRLEVTIHWAFDCLQKVPPRRGAEKPLRETSELMQPLLMLHRSLIEVGEPTIANGLLIDIIRRLSAFGLSLLPLDIRQESTRHSEALDAITR